MTDIFNIAQLIDNLKHEEVSERLRSMQNLDKIAYALGQRRTAQELLPFLCDCVDDDDDILLAMISQLERILPLAGSEYPLVEVLKLLAVGDSKIVRDRAVEALLGLKDAYLVMPLVEEFLYSEWYNYRTSGLQLLRRYLNLTPTTEKRQTVFKALKACTSDPLPMVRRAVGECFSDFVYELSFQEISTLGRQLLKQLSDDPQDAVRAVAAKAYPHALLQLARTAATAPTQLGEVNAVRRELYQKFTGTHCTEHSWRTRYICADVFCGVLEAYQGYPELSEVRTLPRESQDSRACDEDIDLFIGSAVQIAPAQDSKTQVNCNIYISKYQKTLPQGPDFDDAKACQIFAKLLADSEPEVRCVAVYRLVRVCSRVAINAFISAILPVIDDRVYNDDSVFVRVTIARYVAYLAQLLPKDVIQKQIVQIIQKILSDKDANVRVYLLKNLSPVTAVTGLYPFGEMVQTTVLILAQDNDWRVRVEVIAALVEIVRLLDAVQFEYKLKNLIVEYLKDPVNYVRRVAAVSFVQIGKHYGIDWSRKNLVTQALEMSKYQNYLQRNNCLFMCQELILYLGGYVASDVAPILATLCEDSVPNIRFMACEVIGKVAKALPEAARGLLLGKVQACCNDPDKDVYTFAQNALKESK